MSSSDAEARRLAAATYHALERHRLDRRTRLFGRRRWLHWSYCALWPYSSASSAALAVGSLASAAATRRWRAATARYARDGEWDGALPLGLESRVRPPLGPGGERYFDDNAWIGLAACRAFRSSGDDALLGLARRLFAFVCSGWWDDERIARPGGIRWKEESPGRNTCANAPAAALGGELASLLHDQDALDWSVRIYRWTRAALRTPDGLYVDRIAPDGRLTADLWSYNQGAMIGAAVALAAASGEDGYLDEAEETARASLLAVAGPAALAAQPPAFNVIYVRNLLALHAVRPQPAYRAVVASVVEDLRRRVGRNGLVTADDDVAASAALAEAAALLAGAPAHP